MGLSRRQLLKLGGGAALLAAFPVGSHIIWNTRSFDRTDFESGNTNGKPGTIKWQNWSGIQKATPSGIAVPADEQELSAILAAADGPVRPVGSGHSFTGLVPTDGTIIDVSRFNGLIAHDTVNKTVRFGAGTRLRQAAREMSKVGLGFPNMPDVDVQTLAGSYSTATHGAGLSLPPIHDNIIGFRLVTPQGDILAVTQESHPELFAAGKVSLGSLGVITEYTLQVTDTYNVMRTIEVLPIAEVLETAQARAEKHHGFEFYYLPSTGHAALLTDDLYDGPMVEGPPRQDDDSFLYDLKELRDTLGWWPWLRRKIAMASMPNGVVEQRSNEYWRVLTTARPTKFNEMEYHLPMDEGLSALKEIIKIADGMRDVFFPMEVRWTAQDNAWLSPFNDGPRISIATHALHSEAYDYLFTAFEPVHRAHGGRPHWGKLHSLGKHELEQLYPEYQTFLDLRSALDPDNKFANPHLQKLFGV